jgi:hypothetical protein
MEGGSFTVNTITFTNQLYVDISVGTFITEIFACGYSFAEINHFIHVVVGIWPAHAY